MRVSSPWKRPLDPEEYKRRLRADDRRDPVGPQDPGNRAVNFRGERRPRAKRRLGFTPTTLGGDTGFFSAGFIEALLGRGIEPHIAVDPHGQQPAHARVWMRARGVGYRLSQRARKKIEKLFGEGKDWHGLRWFRRRGPLRVRQETDLIGWVLNLKRLATLLGPQLQVT
jgi:Transposase DDE domain